MEPVFRVGDLEVKAFSDGILKTSLDLVLNMDRAQATQLSGADDKGALYIPVNNFVFQRDGKTIMIDAGAGNTMQPTLGKLPANLRQGGIDPASITHILLTHIHPDHANGLVDDAGAPHYPNAELVVHETEFDFWLGADKAGAHERTRPMHERALIDLKPYMSRIRRMKDGEEFARLRRRARRGSFARPHRVAHHGRRRGIHFLGRSRPSFGGADLASRDQARLRSRCRQSGRGAQTRARHGGE